MELIRAEKFEAWLRDEDLLQVRAHMEIAGISKKSEFTREALLAGMPRHDFMRDQQIGTLALLLNQLASGVPAGCAEVDWNQMMPRLKRLVKALQEDRAMVARSRGRRL